MGARTRTARSCLAALAVAGLAAGCAAPLERNPLPAELQDAAQVPGLPGIRFWGDAVTPDLDALLERRLPAFRARYADEIAAGGPVQLDLLALSGGAEDGAFGAGLLVGWTSSGTRPEFRVVAGVSTGALMAPFAFLGPDYDETLRTIYTSLGSADLYRATPLAGLTGGPALADTTPLRRTIARFIDDALLAAIAAEYAKGRNLYIGTANLDAGRPVNWDMGALAASGHPQALQLFRDVLLASAAIPGVFPPVLIEVEAEGRRYDELHVDGGIGAQVFAYPFQVSPRRVDAAIGVPVEREIWVIRNTRLTPAYRAIEPRAVAIAGRAIAVLVSRQGLGDVFRIYAGAQRDGLSFHLAYIPPEFDRALPQPFDRDYMQALFDLGYTLGRSGAAWSRRLPWQQPQAAPSG